MLFIFFSSFPFKKKGKFLGKEGGYMITLSHFPEPEKREGFFGGDHIGPSSSFLSLARREGREKKEGGGGKKKKGGFVSLILVP